MQTHNIAAHIYHLKAYCKGVEWHSVTTEAALDAATQLLALPATENSWNALMELFAAWPDIDDIKNWVKQIEPQINHWPWKLRKSILGQAQTRAEKSCVYRLVGTLIITDCEDLSGHKLRQWSKNEDWSNLKGMVLRKVETEAEHLHAFLASPYLKKLHSIELSVMGSLSTKLPQIFNNLQFSSLNELRLVSLNLTPADVQDINQSTFGSQLKLLDLSSNFVNGKDLAAMFGAGRFPSLQTLVVNYCTVSADNLTNIFEQLHHPSLEEIFFEGTTAAKTLSKNSLKKSS